MWNNITKEEKSQIMGSWTNATLEKKLANKNFMYLKDEAYSGKDVYHVVFKTKNESLLGPIGIYVDPLTMRIIGGDYRE